MNLFNFTIPKSIEKIKAKISSLPAVRIDYKSQAVTLK